MATTRVVIVEGEGNGDGNGSTIGDPFLGHGQNKKSYHCADVTFAGTCFNVTNSLSGSLCLSPFYLHDHS